MNSPTEVYRHYDKNGVLLYVGISYDSDDRANQHKVNSDWYHLSVEMRVEKYDTRKEALLVEQKAIKEEKPLYNISHNKSNKSRVKENTYKSVEYCPKVSIFLNNYVKLAEYYEFTEYHVKLMFLFQVSSDENGLILFDSEFISNSGISNNRNRIMFNELISYGVCEFINSEYLKLSSDFYGIGDKRFEFMNHTIRDVPDTDTMFLD